MIYVLKIPDMMFTPVLGAILLMLYCYVSSILKSGISRILWIIAGSLILYPIAGSYIILAVIISAFIFIAKKKDNLSAISESVGSLLIIAAVVMGYYTYFYDLNLFRCQINPLPDYQFNKREYILWIPYLLFFLSLVFFSLLPLIKLKTGKESNAKNSLIGSSLLAVSIAGIYFLSFTDEALFVEIKVDRALEKQNWNEALGYIRGYKDEQTRKLILSRNVALFHTKDTGNRMFSYREGHKTPNSPRAISLVSLTSRSIYYNYGKFCFCYRWCMEDSVEYGFRVEFLKYMTKCALASGEIRVASKYIDRKSVV